METTEHSKVDKIFQNSTGITLEVVKGMLRLKCKSKEDDLQKHTTENIKYLI